MEGADRRGTPQRAWLLVVAVALVATACGNRLDDAALVAANYIEIDGTALGGDAALGDVGGGADAAGQTGPSESTGRAGSTTRGGDDATPVHQDGSASRGTTPTSTESATAAPGDSSPIVVATIGNYSGIAGSTIGDFPDILRAWAADVNRTGGIDSHPIELIAVDDGADPARHRSLLKELVEERAVVAFIAMMAPLTGASGVEYLNRKRVPVIGGSIADQWYGTSAMHFPHASYHELYYRSNLAAWAPTLKQAGQTKLGTLVCSEAASCQGGEAIWSDNAAQYGLEHVYSGRASLAQPDFTAECIAMRRAGVQAVALSFDINSNRRVASSCARQDYRPRFLGVGTITAPDFAEDPNLDGYIVGAPVFPWTDSSTPARQRFHDAMAAAGMTPSPNGADGWTAAVLFETVADRIDGPVTSAAIIQGLYALDGDDLGGLTGPLRFAPSGPPPLRACGAGVIASDGAWIAFGDASIVCG